MKIQSLSVLLIIASVFLAFCDLTIVIDLLNMGEINLSNPAIFALSVFHLLAVAGWGFYLRVKHK